MMREHERGTPQREVPLSVLIMAPRAGVEPATSRLTAGCSTTELPGNVIVASSGGVF